MKNMWYSSRIWFIAFIVTLGLISAAYIFFPRAFPIVNITITMDRTDAIAQAHKQALQLHIGPEQYYTAVTFDTDETTKTFIELDGGGKEVLGNLLRNHLYEIYTWKIRHFNELNTHEAIFQFTPEGKPYGFIEKISETTPGASLETSQAQEIAEKTARQQWNVPLSNYRIIETSKETKSSGRIDHTFVYERPEKIGNGFYRLTLVVSGDKLTQLSYSIKVPDDFVNRYSEMRSTNETISVAASLATGLLYIVGIFFGLIFLRRKHYLLFNTAFKWGLLIASLALLAQINTLPLLWMSYDTAVSYYSFLSKICFSFVVSFIISCSFYTIVFMVAEGLTRISLGKQLQLWSLWSNNVASSLPVAGRTLGGYLLAAFIFVYVVFFYLFTTYFFNWWTPSSVLMDPNIIASYVPWIQSIASSLQAGFLEECLFRAVPLAGTLIIAQRYGGNRMIWIILASIIQALIFGGAHATYPVYPAYGRVVELFMMSTLFGAVYLNFGLLPIIIAHFLYDVIWYSLPLFLVATPYSYINQVVIIFFMLIPILVVLYARLKTGKWSTTYTAYYNDQWNPPVLVVQEHHETTPTISSSISLHKKCIWLIFISGMFGLSAWIMHTPFKQNALPITISMETAIATAQHTLQKQGIIVKDWYPLATVFAHYHDAPHSKNQHTFIWQQGGEKLYEQLRDSYLAMPQWVIRFVKFEGSITQRAEMYYVFINAHGEPYRVSHVLPETTPGASLSEEEAQKIAYQALQEQFALDYHNLVQVSAIALKHPQRLDWTFTFANPAVYPLENGQARIEIKIAGNEIVDVYRFVHVPEEWERTERNDENMLTFLKQLCTFILFGLLSISFFAQQRISHYSHRLLSILFFLFIGMNILININNWPLLMSSFNTNQPFSDQVFRAIAFLLINIIVMSTLYTFLTTLVYSYKTTTVFSKTKTTIFAGICIGSFTAGISALVRSIFPTQEPLWALYQPLGTKIPWLSFMFLMLNSYIITTLILLGCILFFQKIRLHPILRSIIILCFGLLLVGITLTTFNVSFWIVRGLLLGIILVLFYHYIFRYDHSLIPIASATYVIYAILQQMIFNSYPTIIMASLISIIIISALAWKSFKLLNTHH